MVYPAWKTAHNATGGGKEGHAAYSKAEIGLDTSLNSWCRGVTVDIQLKDVMLAKNNFEQSHILHPIPLCPLCPSST